jgi:hypothetical protein
METDCENMPVDSDTSPPQPLTLLERLHRALGPLAGGIIIDVVDLATFGPIGLVMGALIGGLVGWWVSSIYGFGTRGRALIAILAAIYCTVPFTELFPLATLVAATARFREPFAPVTHDTKIEEKDCNRARDGS